MIYHENEITDKNNIRFFVEKNPKNKIDNEYSSRKIVKKIILTNALPHPLHKVTTGVLKSEKT